MINLGNEVFVLYCSRLSSGRVEDAEVQSFYAGRSRAYEAHKRNPNTMATKTGASHFHISLLGSLFVQGQFFFFLHESSRWCWVQILVPEKTAILLLF